MTDEERRKQKANDDTICLLFDLIPVFVIGLLVLCAYHFGIIFCCIVIPLGLVFIKSILG